MLLTSLWGHRDGRGENPPYLETNYITDQYTLQWDSGNLKDPFGQKSCFA